MPFSPFQLFDSSLRKISNASRAASGSALVHDIDRTECRQLVPVLPQLLSRRARAFALGGVIEKRPRMFGHLEQRASSDRAHHGPERLGVAVEQLQLDDVRQVARFCDCVEERGHHGVRVLGIDHRARDERVLVRRRRQECGKKPKAPFAQRPQPDQRLALPGEQDMHHRKACCGCRAERCRMQEHVRGGTLRECVPVRDERQIGRADFDRNHGSHFAPCGLEVRLRKSNTPGGFLSNINDEAIRIAGIRKTSLKLRSAFRRMDVRQDSACVRPTS